MTFLMGDRDQKDDGLGGYGAHLPPQKETGIRRMMDLGGVGLTSPHKHANNESTCGTVLAEHCLETGRRSPPIQPKLQDRSPRNWVVWGKKASGRTGAPGRDL